MFGRLRQDLKLRQTAASLTKSGADTVSAGVATSDNDYVLTFSGQVTSVFMLTVQEAFRVGVKKLHRKIHALKISSRQREIARSGRAPTKDNRIKLINDLVRAIVHAHVDSTDKPDTFRRH